ncbi:MAG: nucleotidyltransferase family protein [Spirochaetaceae bacterium]|nr:nucleotidyltransferase family protein [Spirochaetaceae bacterium]
MTTLDQIKRILTQKKPILAKAGIKEIGVFGSFVRGEQKPESDLDILIDIERPAAMDLLTLITLEQELSEDLGVSVDLVLKSMLRPALGRTILSEVQYL